MVELFVVGLMGICSGGVVLRVDSMMRDEHDEVDFLVWVEMGHEAQTACLASRPI